MSEIMEKLVIVDGNGSEICCAYDEAGAVDLLVYDDTDFAVATTLDAGGVAALCDWLSDWLERVTP